MNEACSNGTRPSWTVVLRRQKRGLCSRQDQTRQGNEVDDFSVPASVRPTIVRLRTLQCPGTCDCLLPPLHRWLCSFGRQRSIRPSDTPCRAALPATSEHFPGLLGSSPIPPSLSLLAFISNQGHFPPPAIPGYIGTTGPHRHPRRPGLALASCRLISAAIPAAASRVPCAFLCMHVVTNTPVDPMEAVRSYSSISDGLPHLNSGSASALGVSRPARCLLASQHAHGAA